MPYEYRRLSPEEREQVLRARQEAGFPLHAPPHPLQHAGWYIISAATYQHAAVMWLPDRRTLFEKELLSTLQSVGATVAAWTVLPNHYHALLAVPSLRPLRTALGQMHGRTSHEWNRADGCTGKRQVWYHFSDRYMRGDAHLARSLNYIHINAVKHGYVDSPYDWPWHSLEAYVREYGQEWLRSQWRLYPPTRMGKGWDD